MRSGSVLVADDILYSISGKYYLNGIYTSDLTIPVDPTPINQLVFLFIVDSDIQEPFKQIAGEVVLPGAVPIRLEVPIPTMTVIPEGRTKHILRFPVVVPTPALKPGKIEARIIHEDGEISCATPWIVLSQQPGGDR